MPNVIIHNSINLRISTNIFSTDINNKALNINI